MNDDACERFLRYASYARRKPTFDLEERAPRIEISERANAVLDTVQEGEAWIGLLHDLLAAIHGGIAGPYNLVHVRHIRWLRQWSETDPDSLPDCLAIFLQVGESPDSRVARFDDAVRGATAEAGAAASAGAVISLASLFNFALDPARLPIVRTAPFNHLRKVLGLEPLASGSPEHLYRQCLDFAGEIESTLVDHGVPVRDMLDVQSLIFLASQHYPWWASGAEPAAGSAKVAVARESAPKHYLSVCSIYLDEASYLREWIELHRLVGVERFYLYDNASTDEHREVLGPYLREGSVIVHEWPGEAAQQGAYADCLARHRDEARWIAFIDADEFLFSPTGRPVAELLSSYEHEVGVAVNCALFGPGGHRTRPPGLVTESYLRPLESHRARLVKTILDPRAAQRPLTPITSITRGGWPWTRTTTP